MNQKKAIKQLMQLKKLGQELRLAADGWDEDWKILIATLMSARTTDRVTIPIAENLFRNYNSVRKLSKASPTQIGKIIRGVNFYRTKARNISALSKILLKTYGGKVPHDFNALIELPGIGRKTANVFLAEQGYGRIGVDTHVDFCSHQLGWTKGKTQEQVEKDLENLFPKRLWGDLNWILVRFGQTYRGRKEKIKILKSIKRI
ncbi:MAG: endonuclease III [archaeon]